MKNLRHIIGSFLVAIFFVTNVFAQEMLVPLSQNPVYKNAGIKQFASKKTRAVLPFIEDFSYEGPYPDASLWLDSGAYINNTMCTPPPTRGVATLDGLNQYGRPYYSQSTSAGFADSLTSKPIDLSSYTPASNIFFSFFYQPQGVGFAPETGDSLFLFFKNDLNQWVRVWEMRGLPMQAFKIIILPVTDVQYLHAGFQFRFVNIASMNTNDDVWNLDYIKLDANRNIDDSVMNDIAFSEEPTSILKNYKSMPYRHFLANQANEKSLNQDVVINNMYHTPQNVTVNLDATEFISSSAVNNQILSPVTISGISYYLQSVPSYNISYTAPTNKSKVVIRNKYFYPVVNGSDFKRNDTIINDVVFDNYFAYDDGSAEKSYFLLNAANFPSKTALQFTLNEPDTLRGLMVHFGPQLPTGLGKFFSIVLYKSLGNGASADSIIQQEDLFQVQYEPSYNGFSSYAFSTPKLLNAGDYYIGITQPANFGSDSIYYGLDVNTNTSSQHLSYNVDGIWVPSTINGSIMMRPIVGQEFVPTMVQPVVKNTVSMEVYPNPSPDVLHFNSSEIITACAVYNMNGVFEGNRKISNHQVIIKDLAPGNYILVFKDSKGNTISKKINKL